MRLIDMSFKQLVLSKGGRANCALVRQMGRFQRLLVVFGHVIEEFPLVDLAADWTAAGILTLVGQVLHGGRHETVGAEQMSLKTLVSEETELTLLAVERRTVVDHFRVDFNL